MSVYDFTVKTIRGEEKSLADYKGKVLVIVNTASKCGFTPQYEELEGLYQKYKDQGLEILGFPSNQFEQELDGADEIQEFCRLNYGVTFPLFEKKDVRGENAQPLFTYLVGEKKFEGFDLNHPIGERISNHLKNNHPDLLEGDGIKWNFTKFLVDREGHVVGRYEPTTTPYGMEEAIKELL